MQTNSWSLLTLLSIGSLGTLVACDDDAPPSPSAIRAQISNDLPYVLGQSQDAITKTSDTMPAIPSQVGIALRLASLKMPSLAPILNRSADKVAAFKAPEDPIGEDGDFDPDEAAQWLNDNIFTDANHVGGGVYTVPASLVCTSTSIDENGVETESVDPECAADFQKADLRIRVSQNDATLRFAIQLDVNHDEPLELTLKHTAIGASVNLDDASDAMTALATAFGEEAPNAELSGQVTSLLEVPGASHIKASTTIDRAISVKFGEAGVALDSDAATRFATAAGTLFAIDLDGGAQTGSVAVALGATTAHAPGDADPDFPEPSMDLEISGASATVALAAGSIDVSNAALGLSVKEGGIVTSSVNVTPFGAWITGDANGSTIAVTPKLDISMSGTADGERFAVTRILLDGANPTISSTVASEQLKVVSGHLAITTNPAEYSVSVDAGECFAETEMVDTTTQEYYMQWVAQTCE